MTTEAPGEAPAGDDSELTLDEILRIVDALDSADPEWPDLQWFAADQIYGRFLDEGDIADLSEAIRRGQLVNAALGEASASHLYDVALMVWDRVHLAADDADIREYCRLLERALMFATDDAELVAKCEANLATGLVYDAGEAPSDAAVGRAVSLWESALSSGLLDAEFEAGIAGNLAQTLSGSTDKVDLRRAVSYGRKAVANPTDDVDEGVRLEFSLVQALAALETVTGEDAPLDEAVERLRAAVGRLDPGDPEIPGYTAELINLLRRQATVSGLIKPLDEAVRLARELLNEGVDGGRDQDLVLTSAAAALSDAGSRLNDADLLEEAMEVYRRAADMPRESARNKGIALTNLASTCRDAYEHTNKPALLDEGIRAGRRSVSIFDQPGARRAAALTALGNLLRDRFMREGRPELLEEALAVAEEAAALTPSGDPQWAARITNLATLLTDEYDERASRPTLDRAIALYRDLLDHEERVSTRRLARLSDLALALRSRHKDSGNRDDLDEAIQLAEETLAAAESGSVAWAGYASNLGNALAERYELDPDVADLGRALGLFQDALNAAAARPLEASGYATNLGNAYAARARDTGSMDDADQSLRFFARSVDLLPSGHADRAYRLSNLGDAYRQRSIMLDNVGVADFAAQDSLAALDALRDAVKAAGVSDARLLPALSNLAEALRWRAELSPGDVTPDEILTVQRRAAALRGVIAVERFGQSARWANDAEAAGLPDETFLAYEQAVALTTEVAWVGLGVVERLALLREMSDVLSEALAFAVSTGRCWTALAWADHVRSVLWRQERQLASVVAQGDGVRPARVGMRPESDPVRERQRREESRQLAHREAGALHDRVSAPSDYASLGEADVVVLLVPGDDSSFAVLFGGSQEPSTVVLPYASKRELEARVVLLREASVAVGQAAGDDPLPELEARHKMFDCLEWLWDAVTAPALKGLLERSGRRPHVWWSPVGDFALLPLHAAGRHPRKAGQIGRARASEMTVQGAVLSSYAPVVLARQASRKATGELGHLLYVSADESRGNLVYLPDELAATRAALTSVALVELVGSDATIRALRDAIPECEFLHIAGHAGPSTGEALATGFEVADGTFTLDDLAACEATRGSLAVLLTCDSASGDAQSPDQALHVAGAAHQAGFPDVVAATMPVRDAASVAVVKHLYAAVNGEPARVGQVVAEALDEAVRSLRLDPETGADPMSWAPFAHFSAGLVG